MPCPKCGTQDPGPGAFCMSCGTRLPEPGSQPAPQIPGAPPPQFHLPPPAGSQGNYPQPGYQQGGYPQYPYAKPGGQMGSAGTAGLSVWGPFAGYGTRGRHVSWLLNGQGAQAEGLVGAVKARFARREIPNATTQEVVLQRRGLLVDTRPYALIRRGLATAGLYIAQFGKDLYVSQVTYFKGQISNLRVAIVGAMALYQLFFVIYFSSVMSGLSRSLGGGLFGMGGSGPSSNALVGLSCCWGPLATIDALALTILGVFSFWKWLSEKDILAALREPPNEFDIDDIVALEKSVEQTVRESLDVVGIEQKLMPPAAEYGMRRRII